MVSSIGSLPLRVAGATHVGRVRQNNEDSYLISDQQKLYIVSDGMGGEMAGEVASKTVVAVLPRLLEQHLRGILPMTSQTVERVLRDRIVELSQSLQRESAGQAGMKGMGATVALALLRGSSAHLAHMGDSRIYLYRDGELTQLTQDHSITALLIASGDITPEEAQHHPARGKLSRFVGMEGVVYPDVQTIKLRAGDQLLVCSDGLSGPVSCGEIAAILSAHDDPARACQSLIAAANEAGGKDNITAIVIYYGC